MKNTHSILISSFLTTVRVQRYINFTKIQSISTKKIKKK